LYALGIAQYRAGKFSDAIQSLNRSLDAHPAWLGRGQNYLTLAMANHQLGKFDEARDWLIKAKSARNELERIFSSKRFGFADSDYLSDWLTMLVLQPQAEALVNPTE
jgi:tetratricopeptide (TPR) repeat protein